MNDIVFVTLPRAGRFEHLRGAAAAIRKAPRPGAPPPSTSAARPRSGQRSGKPWRGLTQAELNKIVRYARDPARSPFAHLATPTFRDGLERLDKGRQGTAERILAAAALARAGGRERPKPTGTAAAILAAGERRRQLGR